MGRKSIRLKQDQWDMLTEKFSKTTDGLGHPIDRGILETVVVLNALDLPTNGSCEGHINWGLAGPWVDIEAEETKLIKRLLVQNRRRSDEIEKKEREKVEPKVLEKDWEEYHRINAEIRKPSLLLAKKLLVLLGEYYRDLPGVIDKHLVVARFGRSTNRLECQGLMIQEVNSGETQKLKLEEYQEEMRNFTAFLKKKFFEN